MLDRVRNGLLTAPAERVQAGVDNQPHGPHQRRADRAEQAALVGVQAGFLGELLGVQAPAFGEHRQAALPLQRRQVAEQLQPRQLQVMAGHGLVEGHHVDVPAGAGRGPQRVEPERTGASAVQPGRSVVGRRAGQGHDVRHGRHRARGGQGSGKELRGPRLGAPHGRQGPADRFLRCDLPR